MAKINGYKIATATSASQLTEIVKHLMVTEGWQPVGGHGVVETHHQPKYAGKQHMQTVIRTEYSQTLVNDKYISKTEPTWERGEL